MLYVIATPIGNMKDISLRAKELLLSASIIFCEDTRVAEKLFFLLERNDESGDSEEKKHTSRRFISYHKFNEKESIQEAIETLKKIDGHAALISDAGTPAISDPGQLLIQACHEHGIPISIAPGPSAFVSAFALSGFQFEKAQFHGFLPKNLSERKRALYEIVRYDGITAVYESPLRVFETLVLIEELAPKRKVAFIRELTKTYEEILVMPIHELISTLRQRAESSGIKGEIVLVIDSPHKDLETPLSPEEELSRLVQEVLALKERQGISLSEACALVAKASGVKKGALYSHCLRQLS